MTRALERLVPGALALGAAGTLLVARATPGQSAAVSLALAAAVGAAVWALADLEGFVLVPLLCAMTFPAAVIRPGGALIATADLLLLVALAAWLCHAATVGRPAFRLTPMFVPALLFTAVNAASLAWSADGAKTAKTVLQMAEIVVFLPVLYASIPSSLDRIRRGLASYVVLTAGLALATLALAAPRLAHGELRAQYLPGLHKTAAGSFLGVGLVLAFAFSNDRTFSLRTRRLLAAAVVADAAGMVAALSRGAIAGALCGLLVVSLLLRRNRVRTVLLVVLAGVALAVAVQAQLDARLHAAGGYSTNTVRVLSYQHGVDAIARHPVLGTGAGTYWDWIPELRIGLADPNNLFLLTWAELGLAGMAALLFLLFRAARLVARAGRLRGEARVLGVACGGAALSLFVHFQVDSTWNRGTASICFALLGLTAATVRLGRPRAAAVAAGAPPTALPIELPLRVIHVLSSAAFAGIERHVLRLARGLASRGVDVAIACPPRARRLRAEAEEAGIRLVPRSSAEGTRWSESLAREHADVIHVHDGLAAVAGWRLATAIGARLVRTQHFVRTASSERTGWRRALSLALHRSLNADVDALVAVSESAAQAARERREATRISVIAPGIDLPSDAIVSAARTERRELDHPVVAFVGRLEREKALPVLLLAIPAVLERIPDCRFVVAGAGSHETELRELAGNLGLDDSIAWLGEVDSPDPVLCGAHVFVNPSADEGFGLAVAEAMAWSLPVVAARSGGVAEQVDHSESGLLVEPDDPAALADALTALAGDRALAERLGRAGRRRAVGSFGAVTTAERTLALYERLTGR